MKSFAAVLVLVASAAAKPARYVRIYDAQNDASDFINLDLVTVFGETLVARACLALPCARGGVGVGHVCIVVVCPRACLAP
jgi:hypothetical protein